MTARRIDQDMASTAASLLPGEVTKELRTRYRQLRVMLHTAGLAATYAFVASKANANADGDSGLGASLPAAYRLVAKGIRERLAVLGMLTTDPAATTHAEVFTALGNADAASYARASADVAALAGWLSRLADATYRPPSTRGSSG